MYCNESYWLVISHSHHLELKWVSAGLGASYTIIAYYVLASLKNALQMQAHNNVASVTGSWPRKLTDWCGSSIIFQCSVFSLFSEWCSVDLLFFCLFFFERFGCVESFWNCLMWFSCGYSLSGCHFPPVFFYMCVCVWLVAMETYLKC